MKKFFHSFNDLGQPENQGYVIQEEGDRVLVGLFSWLDGRPNGQFWRSKEEMSKCQFYNSVEEMRKAAEVRRGHFYKSRG